MAMAERYNDRRRTKYKMLNNPQLAESLADQFLQEMEQRPIANFEVGHIVYTENGYREILSKYYNSISGWMYRFSERRYSYNLAENEISAIFFKPNDQLTLPSGVQKSVSSIALSSNNTVLLCFEIRPKQYSVYTYTEILAINPPTDFELLQLVWKSFVKGIGNQSYCKEMCEQINPRLAL